MSRARGLEVGLIAALAVAAIGVVTGVRGTSQEVGARPAPAGPTTEVEARSYADMRAHPHGANAEAAAGWFDGLSGSPDLFAPVVQTAADRRAALARRASRRAYDGAPPTIPHRIDQIAVPSCLACHERGATVATLVAPRMSHPRHDSCVQCHVVATDPRPGAITPPPPRNGFVGVASVAGGERAWPGAPPTIPHTTRMRDRCDACHGVFGSLGMRTPHPWQASCIQCHAPSATLDQRAPQRLGAAP